MKKLMNILIVFIAIHLLLLLIVGLCYNSLVNLGSPLSGNTIVVKGGGNGGTNVL